MVPYHHAHAVIDNVHENYPTQLNSPTIFSSSTTDDTTYISRQYIPNYIMFTKYSSNKCIVDLRHKPQPFFHDPKDAPSV